MVTDASADGAGISAQISCTRDPGGKSVAKPTRKINAICSPTTPGHGWPPRVHLVDAFRATRVGLQALVGRLVLEGLGEVEHHGVIDIVVGLSTLVSRGSGARGGSW